MRLLATAAATVAATAASVATVATTAACSLHLLLNNDTIDDYIFPYNAKATVRSPYFSNAENLCFYGDNIIEVFDAVKRLATASLHSIIFQMIYDSAILVRACKFP
jgi:hypothetical protein